MFHIKDVTQFDYRHVRKTYTINSSLVIMNNYVTETIISYQNNYYLFSLKRPIGV